ncbi:MAG: hypothetical protein GX430_05430, partial [Treponema sp.]|nr:hypothetical protein [Treponema sp.]
MTTTAARPRRRTGRFGLYVRAAALSVLCLASAAAAALESRVATVDVTVSLRPDGKATVFYRLEWVVSSGTLGGFYFQGESFAPVWDRERCWADLPGGVRAGLEIKDLGGGRYDVLLAGGRRTGGTSFWNLTYGGDFAAADLVGRTTSPEFGDLVRISWAPVEWDQTLDSRTVRIVLPVTVPGPALSDSEKRAIPMRTEGYVNRENRIDYYGSPGSDGRHYLTLLFFQEKVPVRGSQELVLYFPADYLRMDLP